MPNRCCWLAAFVLWGIAVPHAAGESLLNVAGAREEVVFEPVFKGDVVIYEAGPRDAFSVVLVHGLGDKGYRDFANLIPELAANYHVVAFDLPGFGRSSKQKTLYSPALYATFLRWVTDRKVEGPFAVIGHSLGGAVALRFAATFPQGLERLIIADVPGVLHQIAYSQYFLEEKVSPMFRRMPEALRERLFRKLGAHTVDRVEGLPLNLGKVLGEEAAVGAMMSGSPAAIAAVALSEEDFGRLFAHVEAPTLLLWGAEDTIAPLRTARILERRIPDVRLQLIADSGHVPMTDQPEIFNRRVVNFLAGAQRPEVAASDDAAVVASDRVGRCDGERGVVFVGPYQSLEIVGCTDVHLLHVSAGSVSLVSSEVEMEGSTIVSEDVALKMSRSALEATACRIAGRVAIEAVNSRMDLAAVDLSGEEAAISSPDRSVLVASVCEVTSPHSPTNLHGYFEITAEKPL